MRKEREDDYSLNSILRKNFREEKQRRKKIGGLEAKGIKLEDLDDFDEVFNVLIKEINFFTRFS